MKISDQRRFFSAAPIGASLPGIIAGVSEFLSSRCLRGSGALFDKLLILFNKEFPSKVARQAHLDLFFSIGAKNGQQKCVVNYTPPWYDIKPYESNH